MEIHNMRVDEEDGSDGSHVDQDCRYERDFGTIR